MTRLRVLALLVPILGALAPRAALAEEPAPAPASATASLGLGLHRFHDSFGVDASVTSPSFLRMLRVTGSGGMSFFPRVPSADGSLEWRPFYHGALAVEVGPGFAPSSHVRPYGFGGVVATVLPPSLASDAVSIGGLGGFGLELKFAGSPSDPKVTYFFELGAAGSSARVDKLATRETLISGFLLRAGFRFYP